MEVVLALVVVAIVLAIAFGRSMRRRGDLLETDEEKPKKMSKREKKLAEIRANEPDITIPTINELQQQELEDTGVNSIEGHEGLSDTVKLKVYHRDISSHRDCPPEALRFRLSYGIEPESATVDDVRLTCNREDDDDHSSDTATDTPAAEDDQTQSTSDTEQSEEADHSS